jgi:SprT protein
MRNIVRVSAELQMVVEDKIAECLAKCQPHSTTPIPTPKLVFRQMGQRSGLCCINYLTKTCTLTFNPDFFKNEYNDMVNVTIPHEVAHYVAGFMYGQPAHGHGHYWRTVMSWLGIRHAERCHSYNMEGVKTRQVNKPFRYSCGCQGKTFDLTRLKHDKIQRGVRTWCRVCHRILSYMGCVHNGILTPTRQMVTLRPEPSQQVFTLESIKLVEPPKPIIPPTPSRKIVTRFISGMLVNVEV